VGAATGEGAARGRHVALVLGVSAAAVLLHQLFVFGWWIEDSAISFAYARNLVAGEGLVPWAGGERIEGYSNPTWVLLLALANAVGVEGFTASKVFGAFFAVAALWPTWQIARRAVHPDDRPADLLAPIVLAGSAQFAIWSASGLENGLFGFLLVQGTWRLVAEAERPRFPASALWFLLLSWTRPEGVIYGVVAAAWVVLIAVRDRRGPGTVALWLALFGLPELASMGARLWYFAWPLPNTYYAKVQNFDALWDWRERGWLQLRAFCGWAPTHGEPPGGPGLSQGVLLPVYLAGLLGLRGWRRWAWVAALAVLFAALAVPGPDWLQDSGVWPLIFPRRSWYLARIIGIYVGFVGLPLVALGAQGLGLHRLGEQRWFARGLVFHLIGAGAIFSVYSTGDWMKGYRWMSLFAPTAAILLAVGIGEVASAAERIARRFGLPAVRRGWGSAGTLVAALLVGGQLAVNLVHSRWFGQYPEWPPSLIKLRVDYTTRLAQQVFYDEPVVPLDMDMGAHLWFSQQHPIDMARLVDIPMARHRYDQRAFIDEYVFEEHRPDFVHWHGEWARVTLFSSYDGWSDYFQTPGYRDPQEPGGIHPGIYMRRSLFMEPEWTGQKGRSVAYEGGVTIEGWEVPSPEAGAGGNLYAELALSMEEPADGWQIAVFLTGEGGTRSWVRVPGHGVLPGSEFRPGEVYHARWALGLGDLPPGTYDLGVLLLTPTGGVAPPLDPAAAAPDPVLARGEVRWPGVARVVPAAEIGNYAAEDRAAAVGLARDGDCRRAEAAWTLAMRHVPLDRTWAAANQPSRALSSCWSRLAEEQRGDERVDALARAHRWDDRAPDFLRVSEVAGARLWDAGLVARGRGDWEGAYAAFRDLLRFQPWRSWARRYAEEARDHRLGLHE
jgi:hypothetical protein